MKKEDFREGRLKTARAMAGMSMDRLASAINVSKAKIVAWEKGSLLPTPRELLALDAVYDMFGVRLLSERDRAALDASVDAARGDSGLERIRAWVTALCAAKPVPQKALASQRCMGCGRWVSLSGARCDCAGNTPRQDMAQRTTP